jgi:hypothetical protein
MKNYNKISRNCKEFVDVESKFNIYTLLILSIVIFVSIPTASALTSFNSFNYEVLSNSSVEITHNITLNTVGDYEVRLDYRKIGDTSWTQTQTDEFEVINTPFDYIQTKTLTGLEPNTEYETRLKVENGGEDITNNFFNTFEILENGGVSGQSLFSIEQNNINTALIIFMTLLFVGLSFINTFKLLSSIGILSIGFIVLFSGYPLLFGLLISIVGIFLMFRE